MRRAGERWRRHEAFLKYDWSSKPLLSGFSRPQLDAPPSAEHTIGHAATTRLEQTFTCVFRRRNKPFSSVRAIDKTMSDGHENPGPIPTTMVSQGPDRPHQHSHRNDGGRADLRMSHRAFRSALTCASPHTRTHAREVVVVVLTVPPLPSRCASWRAVRLTSVYLMSAHAWVMCPPPCPCCPAW